MYLLFFVLVALFGSSRPLTGKNVGVARQLMERGQARAGSNPRQARELRTAALAYLSVIR
jgi:hypothetical protein